MSARDDTPFFVGYLPIPGGLRLFLGIVSVMFVVGCFALGYALGATQDDPGPARGAGQHTIEGVLELTPTPILHVTQGTDGIPVGEALMLAGQGKNGAIERAAALEGQRVEARGLLFTRGELRMMQLAGGNRFRATEDQTDIPPVPEAEALGRWRLTGEICDGKCAAGAMRPGLGISHRACANLCIHGGLPPVFVSTQPVEGEEFLLIAGEGDAVMPAALYDYVGLYVTLEADIARHGDLLVMTVDTDSVELVR